MGEYVIKTEETKVIKKLVKKFGSMEVKTKDVDGVIEIKNYRKYPSVEEVDIVFRGKLYVTIGGRTSWMGFDEMQKIMDQICKVKLNRLLRRISFQYVQTRSSFFNVDLKNFRSIKTVKWVS
jgi:hypothetical protein